MAVQIAAVTAEHHHSGFGLFTASPRLSWRFDHSDVRNWTQTSYEISIRRHAGAEAELYRVDSPESVLVPWPSSPLKSRDRATVAVRVSGTDGSQTEWAKLEVEVALIERSQWQAKLISCPQQPEDEPKRPCRLRKKFSYTSKTPARLYATAHGIYEVEINGKIVGDHILAPGWQAYKHRLHYQIYDVTSLLREGENVIGAYVGEGWYAGRLGRPGVRNIWGSRPAFLAQLEIGGELVCATDSSWEYMYGPIVSSELYDGEVYDSSVEDLSWSTLEYAGRIEGTVEELPFPSADLIAPDVAPVRRIMEIQPIHLITTPSGKRILDFGQNLVGWLRTNTQIPGDTGDTVVIRHAEVLENGELGVRPLRSARATDIIKLGGDTVGHEPKFTFHGFRYAEITGFDSCSKADFTAIVISSDLRRTGTFECSHAMINKLHENTVWSMRGNFVSVPTDCPQRDERLGWTGDIQVFAPTANYLYDTSAFLGSWLRDLAAEQGDRDGLIPVIIPTIPMAPKNAELRPMAVWADCSIITPEDLYNSFGDIEVLKSQWESMAAWLDRGVPRGEDGLYTEKLPQFADWLDPRAPPALPGHGPTDQYLVANAYLVYVTKLAATIASRLGKTDAAEKYTKDAIELAEKFQSQFITPSGRLASNTQTAYALALHFGLFPEEEQKKTAVSRLDWITRWESFKITTGFAGTPIILDVLADNGMLNLAYRMLQERGEPSWLYPISMGATTIWERWNSMLPDGSINPGQMTSFNHYALGSVCSFLHRKVGGLSAAAPGWRKALVRPRPGGTLAYASTSFDSPYGTYSVNWKKEGDKMVTIVAVPPNGEAKVVLLGVDEVVGSGVYEFKTPWGDEPDWPPKPIEGAQGVDVPDEFEP